MTTEYPNDENGEVPRKTMGTDSIESTKIAIRVFRMQLILSFLFILFSYIVGFYLYSEFKGTGVPIGGTSRTENPSQMLVTILLISTLFGGGSLCVSVIQLKKMQLRLKHRLASAEGGHGD